MDQEDKESEGQNIMKIVYYVKFRALFVTLGVVKGDVDLPKSLTDAIPAIILRTFDGKVLMDDRGVKISLKVP